MPTDRRQHHQELLKKLSIELAGNTEPLRMKKKTISNLFRYEGRRQASSREVDLRAFDRPLHLDEKNQTLDVQGLATYESIVDFVLPRGFTPVITPELKHITVGGATVGIGIETNSFRYGFVHDSLLEADVLLADGRVVLASPDNEHADLFHGLANSYGTLGYILRARIRLHNTLPYVRLTTRRFNSPDAMLKEMKQANDDPQADYIESLAYSPKELYLTVEKQVDQPTTLRSTYGPEPFYRLISQSGSFELPIREFLFRYDPDSFWGVPTTGVYGLFRRLAPRKLRNTSFYTRYARFYTALDKKLPFLRLTDTTLEPLIQDWEVPWKHAASLLNFALSRLDLDDKPLMSGPLTSPGTASLYPIRPQKLYYNLGSYNFVKKQPGQQPYDNTKIMDRFCFDHEGIKMLYSSSFFSREEFEKYYNGPVYSKLKIKYDPLRLLPSLFDKAVRSR